MSQVNKLKDQIYEIIQVKTNMRSAEEIAKSKQIIQQNKK